MFLYMYRVKFGNVNKFIVVVVVVVVLVDTNILHCSYYRAEVLEIACGNIGRPKVSKGKLIYAKSES